MLLLKKKCFMAWRLLSVCAVAGGLLVLGGCGGVSIREYYFGDIFKKSSSSVNKSAEQLVLDGTKAMQTKDYGDAIKAFKQLKEQYPYSKLSILAELKLGDAYFHNKDYSEAAIAYEEFARLHPRNEVVPYVLYQIGMCHFLAFSTTDRDQEETRLAMEAFQRVAQTFPQSDYAMRAQKQIYECQKRIVAHELEVGRVYYRLEEYSAARKRLTKIVTAYPQAIKDLGHEEEVRSILAECARHVGEDEKKPSVWSRLGF